MQFSFSDLFQTPHEREPNIDINTQTHTNQVSSQLQIDIKYKHTNKQKSNIITANRCHINTQTHSLSDMETRRKRDRLLT